VVDASGAATEAATATATVQSTGHGSGCLAGSHNPGSLSGGGALVAIRRAGPSQRRTPTINAGGGGLGVAGRTVGDRTNRMPFSVSRVERCRPQIELHKLGRWGGCPWPLIRGALWRKAPSQRRPRALRLVVIHVPHWAGINVISITNTHTQASFLSTLCGCEEWGLSRRHTDNI